MASASPTSDSTAARERGNAFYRKGQFTEAEKAYKEAASLAPEDPAPWSNISAIKFEQGDYAGSLKNLEKALSLSSAEPENGPKKQKLYTRMAKCHLHSLSLSKASQAVEALSDDASGKDLRASFKEMESLWSSALDADKSWENIVDRLPRYKGSLQDAPEYYAFGHDQAEPLFDAPLWPLMSGKDPVSFLFCGSGDARHLFVTIVALFVNKTVASVGGPAKGMASAPAHFTLVDINAAALARTLIIFDMTFRYGVMKAQKLPRIEDALTVLAYMYSSAFIPKFVAEKILEHVRTLIDHFEDTEDGVGTDYMFMLYIPKETRIQVLRKLKQWTEPLGAMNATKRLRPMIQKQFAQTRERKRAVFGEDHDKTDNKDDKEFAELAVVFGDTAFIKRREPELLPLLEAFRAGSPGSKKQLLEHVDSQWVVNQTVLDMDYEKRTREESGPGMLPNWDFNPADILKNLPNPMTAMMGMMGSSDNSGVLKGISEFFDLLSVSVMTLHERLKIELIAGEMADVFERLRYDGMEHRKQKPTDSEAIDPTLFPRAYDRIHLSNIPDYVGGPLTALMYGMPLLHEGRPSNLRFNNLLNPPMFDTHDHFLAEYMLMHDSKQVADHFGAVREVDPNAPKIPEEMKKLVGDNTFMVENYFPWALSGTKKVPRNRMMSRPALENWLYGHLLKICIPYPRPIWSDRPVHAPLNLTALLRLITQMHKVGYPAHWLSNILYGICEGSVKTTARAPREITLRPESLKRSYPQRTMSLGPWRAEFTTLLSIWRRNLPFGVIAPERALVPLDEILECSFTFPRFREQQDRVMHFTLVFVNVGLVDAEQPDLRKALLDDEAGYASDSAARFRKVGVHIVTAFKFVTDTRTATFWMRKDILDEIMSGDSWAASICRTDTWDIVNGTKIPVSQGLQTVGPWNQA